MNNRHVEGMIELAKPIISKEKMDDWKRYVRTSYGKRRVLLLHFSYLALAGLEAGFSFEEVSAYINERFPTKKLNQLSNVSVSYFSKYGEDYENYLTSNEHPLDLLSKEQELIDLGIKEESAKQKALKH